MDQNYAALLRISLFEFSLYRKIYFIQLRLSKDQTVWWLLLYRGDEIVSFWETFLAFYHYIILL